MQDCLVSIVVPVYNMQSYVIDCLKSIVNQDYKNIEIILVNDGSTDSSRQICMDFISDNKDGRIKLFDKINGGLSDARNFGLEQCSLDSKYVMFVDSDDEVASNYVSSLLLYASESSLSIGGFQRCHKKDIGICRGEENVIPKIYSNLWHNREFLSCIKDGIINSCCNKCYSLDLIRKNKIRFKKTLPEDTLFNIEYIKYCDVIYLSPSILYYYIIREESMSTSPHELIYINYIDIQKYLYSKVPDIYHRYVDEFVYPQYLANTKKYLNIGNVDIVREYLKNPYIKRAISSHSPTCFGDMVIKYMFKYGLFKLLTKI